MSAPRVSDHALVRFLQYGGGLDIEALRLAIGTSLVRAHTAARSISDSDYVIRADGMAFVVRGEVVTTVLDDLPGIINHALDRRPGEQR